jgi:AmmeMemoRadiSam system protein B
MAKIRRPTQAGAFYEGDAGSLRAQVEGCFLHKLGPQRIPVVDKTGPRKIVGLVCPHAGYMYSGPVAALSYFELALDGKPDVVVILGPNHTGLGSPLAIMNDGFWRTPLGDVQVDGKVADAVVNESGLVDVDEYAHLREHSIEVQLPFLQFLYGSGFKLVPICFMMQDLVSAQEIGRALVEVLAGKNAVIVASSDFSHYEPAAVASRKDLEALKAVEALDEKLFYSVVEEKRVSACGYGPIAALITAAKGLGVTKGKILGYKTSGDVTGDFSSVVGYAAVSFKGAALNPSLSGCL